VFALKLLVCKCNVLPELSSVPFHEGISNGGTAAPLFLTFGQRWRWGVRFTPLPLYPMGRATSTKLIGSLIGPSVGLKFRNTENLLHMQETRNLLGLLVRSLVSIPPDLSRLSVCTRDYVNLLTPELNRSAQRCLTRFFLLGTLLLELCISLIYAWKTNKYTNYYLSLLIMYGSSYMFWHYIAIFRERS
jgi:hypothetical protein